MLGHVAAQVGGDGGWGGGGQTGHAGHGNFFFFLHFFLAALGLVVPVKSVAAPARKPTRASRRPGRIMNVSFGRVQNTS
jgi:hypothetical protein